MYTKRRYGFWMTLNWSKKPLIYGFLYSSVLVAIHYALKKYIDIDISLNWQPLGVLGIAVAFYLGFKNNASYDRTWEARKIWGGIVNTSRTFGAAVCSFIKNDSEDKIRRELIYRHLAWITALRYQLRVSKEWEHPEVRMNGVYSPEISESYYENLENEITQFITREEFIGYKGKANIAAQILAKQASRLQQLQDTGSFDDFRHMEFHKLIAELYNDQGRSERIKNFPFPRQYASVAYWITLLFSLLLPLGLINIFKGDFVCTTFIAIPFSALIIWVFFLMEMIGDFSENPFEGSYNDVPITSISKNIEIDLKEMLNESDIPKPTKSVDGFLM